MSSIPAPRIVDAPGMLLAGIRRHHRIADAHSTIPRQWQEFRSLKLRSTRAPAAFGVICGADRDGFEYMTALQVEDFETIPSDLGRLRVPPQQYAVFKHEGNVSSVERTWAAIEAEWLPGSGYEDARTPAFERYDQQFDPDTGDGGFEIWYPIKAV